MAEEWWEWWSVEGWEEAFVISQSSKDGGWVKKEMNFSNVSLSFVIWSVWVTETRAFSSCQQ